ncbi:hypothetical protein E6P97_03575 [Patescibacteria group bacterium]|nr:MAG: hypothetical protein E6P97_03575 [Patescibacteria group bacterium]
MKLETYRDQEWLENLLADIWYRHFSDVPQENDVRIVWGKRAKRRLGSISLDPVDRRTSIIRVNRIFQDLEVPEMVIRATIFHELTHYAHGFNSPLEQKQRHPHSGGVIRKEFAERGQEKMYILQQKWLKQHWIVILKKHGLIQDTLFVRYSMR